MLLAIWRDRIDEHYRELVPRLERGVIIGAFAMLFWPAMDYGYQQTANVLFGRLASGPQLRLSLVIAPWALLLLFYFLRRLGKQGEMIGQISGVVVAAVAVLRYEQLNDWAVRLLGIGAEPWFLVRPDRLASRLRRALCAAWRSRYPADRRAGRIRDVGSRLSWTDSDLSVRTACVATCRDRAIGPRLRSGARRCSPSTMLPTAR